MDYRLEWDKSIEINEEFKEFRTDNTMVCRIVNKSIANTSQREFIDKKIYFKSTDNDDIYLWITSCPDELHPINNYTRSDSLLGINRMGKRTDGKPGCYLHSIVQTDVKISPWFNNVLLPIVAKNMTEWG